MTKSFYQWMHVNAPSELSALKSYMENSAEQWKLVRSLDQAWDVIDQDSSLDAAQADLYRRAVSSAFVQFMERRKGRFKFGFGPSAFGFGVFLFMAFVLVLLMLTIFELQFSTLLGGPPPEGWEPLLERLKDTDTARGLITFVFTIGVVSLALIIVTANVTAQEEDKERFDRSKDILFALIAILGTILGFYFGTQDSSDDAANRDPPPVVTTPPTGTTTDTDTDTDSTTQGGTAQTDQSADTEGASGDTETTEGTDTQ